MCSSQELGLSAEVAVSGGTRDARRSRSVLHRRRAALGDQLPCRGDQRVAGPELLIGSATLEDRIRDGHAMKFIVPRFLYGTVVPLSNGAPSYGYSRSPERAENEQSPTHHS